MSYLRRKLFEQIFSKFFLSRFVISNNDDIVARSSAVHVIAHAREKTVRYQGLAGDNIPHQIKRHIGTKRIPETRILKFNDVKLIAPEMVTCIDGKFLPPENVDSEKRHTQQVYKAFGLKRLLTACGEDPDYHVEDAFLAAGGFRGQGFPKMFIEVLPKLRWYEQYCKDTNTQPLLLFPPMPDAQRRLLKHFGYFEGDYKEVTDSAHIHCKRLLLPSTPIRTWQGDNAYNPDDLRWVVDTIKQGIAAQDAAAQPDSGADSRSASHSGSTSAGAAEQNETHTRLYVGRSNTKKRLVENEDEVIATLQRLGFTWFGDPGDLPLEDQIRLFSEAKIIVGAHGSGLNNMIFASNAVVIELHAGEDGVVGHYFVTANDLGLTYDFLVCESDKVGNNKLSKRHQHVSIDTQQLEQLVSHYLGELSK